jgi:hypothetical protein
MFGLEIFRKNVIQDAEALACFDLMAWLICEYGPPRAPKVPSPLCRAPRLTDICWSPSDSRPPLVWAKNTLTEIKRESGLDDWNVQIMDPNGSQTRLKTVPPRGETPAASSVSYQLDRYGRPVIPFNSAQCHADGEFAAYVIWKLAELKRAKYEPAETTDAFSGSLLTIVSAAHSGQGFHLLPMRKLIRKKLLPENASSALTSKQVQMRLIFAACLGLRALNRSPEQIIAAYGCLTSGSQRRKIRAACEQIESFDTELKRLQLICATPRRRERLEKQMLENQMKVA